MYINVNDLQFKTITTYMDLMTLITVPIIHLLQWSCVFFLQFKLCWNLKDRQRRSCSDFHSYVFWFQKLHEMCITFSCTSHYKNKYIAHKLLKFLHCDSSLVFNQMKPFWLKWTAEYKIKYSKSNKTSIWNDIALFVSLNTVLYRLSQFTTNMM